MAANRNRWQIRGGVGVSLLVEGEWELDGYRFGGGGESRRPVFVLASPLDYGDPALRTQDVDAPGRDGVMVGRDYLGGAEIQMTLGVIDDKPPLDGFPKALVKFLPQFGKYGLIAANEAVEASYLGFSHA